MSASSNSNSHLLKRAVCCIQAHDRAELATLVHDMWFTWHAARWTCSLSRLGAGSSACGAEGISFAGQEGPVRSRLVAGILDGGRQASLSTTAAKALQLRLAARHVSRCSCLCAGTTVISVCFVVALL